MLIYLLPIIIGIFSVLQSGMNSRLLKESSLSFTVFFNNLILLFLAAFYLVSTYWISRSLSSKGSISSNLLAFDSIEKVQVWHFLPGIFGFFIILGLPALFEKLGATPVMVGVVASQLGASLIWDTFVENKEFDYIRLLGCLLALGGAIIAMSRMSKAA